MLRGGAHRMSWHYDREIATKKKSGTHGCRSVVSAIEGAA
jgi:hypothetical protein